MNHISQVTRLLLLRRHSPTSSNLSSRLLCNRKDALSSESVNECCLAWTAVDASSEVNRGAREHPIVPPASTMQTPEASRTYLAPVENNMLVLVGIMID